MPVFILRSPGYKGGLILLVFATILFVVGFAAPYWITGVLWLGPLKLNIHDGLWKVCSTYSLPSNVGGDEHTVCAYYDPKNTAGWTDAVRGLECLCLIGLSLAWVFAIVLNCRRSVQGSHSRALEILSALSGLLGFIGCMVYVGKANVESLYWAFYLTTVGSGLCVIAAVVIAVFNKPLEAGTEETGNAVAMATISQGHGQGQGQDHAGAGRWDGQPPSYSGGKAWS